MNEVEEEDQKEYEEDKILLLAEKNLKMINTI